MTGSEPRWDATVARAWHSIDKPFPFAVGIAEIEPPYFIQLRVWENEVMSMTESQYMQMMEYLVLCQNVIQSYGIRCDLGGVHGDPPNKTNYPLGNN